MAFQYPNDFPNECDKLNREHEHIVKLVNKFETMVNAGSEKSDVYETYCDISKAMLGHFLTEEIEMRSKSYDGVDHHIAEHKELYKRLACAAELFSTQETRIEALVLEFFYKWFLHHVSTSDRKFGEFLLNGQTS